MPLTWFAHQAPVLVAKRTRPRWIDATAMCLGSMAPDASYSFSAYLGTDQHRWPDAYTYGVPLTLLAAVTTRFLVAPVLAPLLPDAGSFRLRSYAVIGDRRPAAMVTVASALVGIWSHVAMDWFTHPGRPGPRWLGYDDVSVRIGGHSEPLAGVFQLVGHTLGTAAGVALLWSIGRGRLLERWYGEAAVDRRRREPVVGRSRRVAASWVLAGFAAGTAWGWNGEFVEFVQRPVVGAFAGAVMAAVWVRRSQRRPG